MASLQWLAVVVTLSCCTSYLAADDDECHLDTGCWRKLNKREPVCVSSDSHTTGEFNSIYGMNLKALRLRHRSGSFQCGDQGTADLFGCSIHTDTGEHQHHLSIFLTDGQNSILYPEFTEPTEFYSIPSITRPGSMSLLDLPLNDGPLSVTTTQTLRLQTGQALFGIGEVTVVGSACFDVYGLGQEVYPMFIPIVPAPPATIV